jgi:uncharacterized protein (DUF608 family)
MFKYGKEATAARFLLGGIGTGNISIGARGEYTDFEIFNNPQKGNNSPYTFFVVRTEDESGNVVMKALESQIQPPYTGSHGFNAWEIGGLPRFRNSEMTSEYPFVRVHLQDPNVPVTARLEAFTPFIPLDTDNSSLPAAIISYEIKNISANPLQVSVIGSFANLCNYVECDIWSKPLFEGESINQYVNTGSLRGISFQSASKKPDKLEFMDMTFVTTEENVTYREHWNEGSWWDGLQDFWNDVQEDGLLDNDRKLLGEGNQMHISPIDIASLGSKKEILPGDTKKFTFILSWHHPNRISSWNQLQNEKETGTLLIKNYYAKFGNSLEVAKKIQDNMFYLEGESRKYAQTITASSFPDEVKASLENSLTVIRSNTCFRVEDGTFFSYEGCFKNAGCCDGNCTHVLNYAYTLAYYFPELERSMRKTEFLTEMNEDGSMEFRARRYFNDEAWEYPPAADGQLGSVIRLYREWRVSGDDNFLRELWPGAKMTLLFAQKAWDLDKDGMLEGRQHNTYDIEFYGPTSMINTIWIAALKAGEKIAEYLKEDTTWYTKMVARASYRLEEITYNGEYYQQNLEDDNTYKYQYGKGCLSDQLFGQLLAHANHLGYVLDETRVKSAVKAIFKYNYKEDMNDVTNLQRTYALNDEPGLLLCSWPKGGRPEIPFVYSDEVWTGIEYHVAAHLIYEGYMEEGLTIVKGIHARHDGIKRSPWDEVECGHHYTRALSSYCVILALTGFESDIPNKKISFKPVIHREDFSTFFSCGKAWGMFYRKENGNSVKYAIKVCGGSLEGISVYCDDELIQVEFII